MHHDAQTGKVGELKRTGTIDKHVGVAAYG